MGNAYLDADETEARLSISVGKASILRVSRRLRARFPQGWRASYGSAGDHSLDFRKAGEHPMDRQEVTLSTSARLASILWIGRRPLSRFPIGRRIVYPGGMEWSLASIPPPRRDRASPLSSFRLCLSPASLFPSSLSPYPPTSRLHLPHSSIPTVSSFFLTPNP
jgi:hypothetical protein